MKKIKILKYMPIIGVVLLVLINFFGKYVFYSALNPMTFYFENLIVPLILIMTILPSVYLIVSVLRNSNFREKVLKDEINISEKDERESAVVGLASKKAFASMHLATWLVIALYYPIVMIAGPLGFFDNSFGLSFLMLLLTPLAIGNYVLHKNTSEIDAKNIGKTNKTKILIAIGVIIIIVIGFEQSKDIRVGISVNNLSSRIGVCQKGEEEEVISFARSQYGIKDVTTANVDGKETFHYGFTFDGAWQTADLPLDNLCQR